MIYFVADTHFFHKRMLEFRPFESVEEMNQIIIDNWNKIITDKDEIYHLGDVSFARWEFTAGILAQLKGRKHLILGNHDHKQKSRFGQYFESVQDYKEIKWKESSFILMHYPILKWNRGHYGTIHLHGHSHGNLKDEGIRRFDIGVDVFDYKPVSIETIIEMAESRPLAEYHH